MSDDQLHVDGKWENVEFLCIIVYISVKRVTIFKNYASTKGTKLVIISYCTATINLCCLYDNERACH